MKGKIKAMIMPVKAQMEMLGIVFVVLLVVIGMMFMIGSRLKPKKEVQKEFAQSEIGKNLLSSVLATTSECGYDIADLVVDCAETKRIFCAGQDSCVFVNGKLGQILAQTLGTYGYGYELAITRGMDEVIAELPKIGDCSGQKIKNPGIHPIPTGTGNVINVMLKVCVPAAKK